MTIRDIPEDFNEYLLTMIDDLKLERFHTGSMVSPSDSEELHSSDYYEIYIDFDDGTQIYGHSNDEKELAVFGAIEDELFERLDVFFR